MRTSEFTFKKTKRVKTVTEHSGICIDLTVQEAADLAAYLKPASTPDCRFSRLYDALTMFAAKHGATSDLSAKADQVLGYASFQMVKR